MKPSLWIFNTGSLFQDRVSDSSNHFISHPILIKFSPIAFSPLNNLFESEALVLVFFPVAHLAILKASFLSRTFFYG